MKNIGKLISFFLLSLFAVMANAQKVPDLGGVPFLSITPDARSAGMALTGTALSQNAFGIFHNPAANLFSENNLGAGYSFSPWLREVSSGSVMHTVGAYYNIDRKNGISLGFRHFKHFDVNESDENGNIISSFNPKDFALDIAYSRMIIDNLAFSVVARFISSDMGYDNTATAVSFDIGMIYKRAILGMSGADWSVGFNIGDLGTKLKYDTRENAQPGKFTIGGGVNLPFSENHILTCALDLRYQFQPSDASLFESGLGVEYTFLKHGIVRAGYHLGNKDKGYGNFTTVGAGFRYGPAQLDFSYLITNSDSALKNTLCVTAAVYFGL